MKQLFTEYNPKQESLKIINRANRIIDEWMIEGYKLTLRQLYYQFVARDLLENAPENYTKLGKVISRARLGGLIDWSAIEDRTRNLVSYPEWSNPEEIILASARSFRTDTWVSQTNRVEVWVEKEALAGIVARAARTYDVPYFSCRGYTSQSEMYRAAMRLISWEEKGYKTFVIHLGDHDPSGIDMTRDIEDRLKLFGAKTQVNRIALNMSQIREYDPPPNPAKFSDSRINSYVRNFGYSSWELDALQPDVLSSLIINEISKYMDEEAYNAALEADEYAREEIEKVADNYEDILKYISAK